MILTRALSLEERREQREREARAVKAREGLGLREVLQAVEEDLRSAMVPLRARGITTITKVVHALPRERLVVAVAAEGADEEARESVSQVAEVLVGMLADADSYVYLAAVQALAVLR